MALKQRERILAVIVVALLAFFGLRAVGKRLFFDRVRDVETRIAALREENDEMDGKMRSRINLIKEWQGIYSLTLADNPEAAQGLLFSRINTLLDQAALQNKSVKTQNIEPEKSGPDLCYYPVAVTLSCDGTLDQFVKFLDMLDQEPYLVKAKVFTLKANERTDLLGITGCRVEALVLAKPVGKEAFAGQTRTVPATLPVPNPRGAYAAIFEKDILRRPGKEAPATVARSQEPIRPALHPGRTGTPPVPTAGPGRPGDLEGVVVIDDGGGIYLRNSDDVHWYQLGESVQGYRLALLHPFAVVLTDPAGRALYLPTGRNIDQAKPLTAENAAADDVTELYQAWEASRRSGR